MKRKPQIIDGYVTYYKINPTGIVMWQKNVMRDSNYRFSFHNPDTPKEKKVTYQGEITPHSRRRLAKAIQLLADITEPRWLINPVTKKRIKFSLAFWTLTLSAPQYFITDHDIKKNLLEPFLRKMRTKGLRNYIWKSELQRNGNLHFHLLTDFFTEYTEIRDIWNNCQSKLGFLQSFERKYGHSTPNSTDVKAVKDIKNLAGYLYKYMLKPSDKSKQQKLSSDINLQRKGKVWDCSLNLKIKNSHYDYLTDQLYNHLAQLEKSNTIRAIHSDFFKVFFLDKSQRQKLIPKQFLQHYNNYISAVKSAS